MNNIAGSLSQAFSLILHLDQELLSIILLSLRVSGSALVVSIAIGLPLAAFMAFGKFPLKGIFVNILNTFMGLPPVVVGLLVYLFLSRSGPFGFLALLYTPSAMIIAQTILALPIVASLTHSAIVSVDPIIRQAAKTLGATPLQISLTVIREARYGIMSGIMAAFGRVMAEVGAILIVGGNIAGYTRVMTTTIALETDKGNFELALALGLILLAISLAINVALNVFRKKGTAEA
ncbi:MAG: ABC transporter permease subunit [Nitrospirae bacterium]|nr:MAG: ABC transporter permease subunit [Nitrospirota bacterium]